MVRCKECKFWFELQERTPRFCVHPLIVSQHELIDLTQKASVAIVVDNDEDALLQTGPEYGCVHGISCMKAYPEQRIENVPLSVEELEEWDEWVGRMLYPGFFGGR